MYFASRTKIQGGIYSHLYQNKQVLLILILGLTVSCSNKLSQHDATPTPPPIRSFSEKLKSAIPHKLLKEYLQNAPLVLNSKKHSAPFDTLQFDKVIAYDYEGSEEAFGSVIKNGSFISIIEKQQALNDNQVNYLIDDVLTSNSTYAGGTAACFNPHLGIVFFKDLKPVMVIDICLDCNALNASIDIPASLHREISAEGESYLAAYGFSDKGQKRIVKLAQELDFYYANFKIR